MELDTILDRANLYSWLVLFLYAFANAATFGVTYGRYNSDPAFYYTRLLTDG